jgi:predicted transcriptional regulator
MAKLGHSQANRTMQMLILDLCLARKKTIGRPKGKPNYFYTFENQLIINKNNFLFSC